MDKKGLKSRGAAALKAIKELEAAFASTDPKTRIEMTGYAKELSGRFKEAGKNFTVESRFRILKKRGRPSGSTKGQKRPSRPAAKKTVRSRPVAKKSTASKPVAKKATVMVAEHPDLNQKPQS